MKKALFLMLLVGSVALANAQSAIGVKYQNQVYNEGDTLTMVIPTNCEDLVGISLVNQSNSRLENLIITFTEIESNGISIVTLCTGEVCINGLVSNPITLAIHGTYNDLHMGLDTDPTNQDAFGLYTMNIANDNVSTTIVVRILFGGSTGIDEAEAMASLRAYPNPCEGEVTISYATGHPATLVVFDATGRQVLSQQVADSGTLRLADLPAGLYAYGIAGSKALRKLVVK